MNTGPKAHAVRWEVSAGAVLLFALLYFFDDAGLISALAPAALAHELGHAAALLSCGARLRRVRIGVFGVELGYAGLLSGGRAVFAAAAGPAAGALYAAAAFLLGGGGGGSFWRLSGAVSVALTAFNLLPALPLDGGRLVEELVGGRFAQRLSRVTAAGLALGGFALFAGYHTLSLLVMGLWLCYYNFRDTWKS